MNPLEQTQQAKLYWWLLIAFLVLSSFNAIWSSTNAALTAAEWVTLSGQKKFQIIGSVLQNWSGVVVGILLASLKRMGSGKPPIETGDTDHLKR